MLRYTKRKVVAEPPTVLAQTDGSLDGMHDDVAVLRRYTEGWSVSLPDTPLAGGGHRRGFQMAYKLNMSEARQVAALIAKHGPAPDETDAGAGVLIARIQADPDFLPLRRATEARRKVHR